MRLPTVEEQIAEVDRLIAHYEEQLEQEARRTRREVRLLRQRRWRLEQRAARQSEVPGCRMVRHG